MDNATSEDDVYSNYNIGEQKNYFAEGKKCQIDFRIYQGR